MAKTKRQAVATRTSVLLLTTDRKAAPVWVASRKNATVEALAERLIAKLRIVAGPMAALVTFEGKPSDTIIDVVGNLASLLNTRSMPQCEIRAAKPGRIAVFLWRNRADLQQLQTIAQDDPAFAPELWPLALLGERWASAATSDRDEAARLRELVPERTDRPKAGGPGRDAGAETSLAREPGIGQDKGSVDRGEQWRGVEDGGAEASRELEKLMQRIGARLPPSFHVREEIAVRLADTFREQLATVLQAPLNAHLATLPQETYEEKQALVLWLNAELRRFGLAIRCPKTERASLLQVDVGRHPERGRFQTDNVNENGERERPLSFNDLIPLELMPDDLSRATWGKWAGPSQGRPGGRRRG